MNKLATIMARINGEFDHPNLLELGELGTLEDDIVRIVNWPESQPHVVVVGNPLDGLILIGPFDGQHEAMEFVNRDEPDSDWWVAPVESPDPEVEEHELEPSFCVDGHEYDDPESNMLGDGQWAPFRVFDINAQGYLPGEYNTRQEAEEAMVAHAISVSGDEGTVVMDFHHEN